MEQKLIYTNELLAALNSACDKHLKYEHGISHAICEVLAQLAIDPIHAAGACYCRECKWKEKCLHHREQDGGIFGDSDFCSYGERRDDNG